MLYVLETPATAVAKRDISTAIAQHIPSGQEEAKETRGLSLRREVCGHSQRHVIPTPFGVGSESIISRFCPSDRVGAGRGQNVDSS